MQLITIRIANWAKHNARPDRANYTWFRFQNDFFQDQRIFGLTDADIILFQMLLCEASKKNRDEVQVNLDLLAALRKTTLKKLSTSIKKLQERKLIAGADDHQAVEDDHQLVVSSPATDIHTDITDKTNKQTLHERFKSSWTLFKKKFPNAVRGANAEARYTAQVTDPKEIDAAISNYAQFLKLPDNNWRKPKTSFETFLGTSKSGEFWREFAVWQETWGQANDTTDWDKVFGHSSGANA